MYFLSFLLLFKYSKKYETHIFGVSYTKGFHIFYDCFLGTTAELSIATETLWPVENTYDRPLQKSLQTFNLANKEETRDFSFHYDRNIQHFMSEMALILF